MDQRTRALRTLAIQAAREEFGHKWDSDARSDFEPERRYERRMRARREDDRAFGLSAFFLLLFVCVPLVWYAFKVVRP